MCSNKIWKGKAEEKREVMRENIGGLIPLVFTTGTRIHNFLQLMENYINCYHQRMDYSYSVAKENYDIKCMYLECNYIIS